MISQMTAAGFRPASRARSTLPSVWPARAGLGAQGENVARRHQIPGAGVVGHRNLNGVGAVGGGNARGHAGTGFNGDGEIGSEARAVALGHERQFQLVHKGGAEGKADQAARVAGHEVDGFGGHVFGGDGDVAFVLAILVVHQNDHPALADFFHGLFNTANSHSQPQFR